MAYAFGHPRTLPRGATRCVPCVAAETAVLVIDVQEYCSRPQRGCHVGVDHDQMPYFFDRVSKVMVPNIARLLAAARAAGAEVIYTVIESLTRDGRESSLDYKLSGPLFVPKGHPDAAVLPEVAPRGDEIVLPKTSCSVFCSTNVNYVLRNLGARYLLVCGQLTNQCVESAVRDAADHGYLVTLPEDACAARSADDHASALHNLKGFSRVVSTDDLVAELDRQRPPAPAHLPCSANRVCLVAAADDPIYSPCLRQMSHELLHEAGARSFEIVEVSAKAGELPSCRDEAFAGYMVLGSPDSVASGVPREPWVGSLLAFIRDLHAAERPLIGICFGHQAIAAAMGGVVAQNPAGIQLSHKGREASEAARQTLGLDAAGPVHLLYHHNDAVMALPPSARSWGWGASGHWGATFANGWVTTQAHPEFSTPTGKQVFRKLIEHEKTSGPLDVTGAGASPQELDEALSAFERPTDHVLVGRALAQALQLCGKRKCASP